MVRVNIKRSKTMKFQDINIGECFYQPSYDREHFFIKTNAKYISEKKRNAISLKDWSHWLINEHDDCIIVSCKINILS